MSNTQSNEELYRTRVNEVIEHRKKVMFKKIADKISANKEEIEENISFAEIENGVSVLGFVTGRMGVCELTGTIKVTETAVAGKCISADRQVKIIWP
tara:strand:- start:62 stop:352 length:291 start_codon:yes stop_codon:yes gene_type:complete